MESGRLDGSKLFLALYFIDSCKFDIMINAGSNSSSGL